MDDKVEEVRIEKQGPNLMGIGKAKQARGEFMV